MKILQAGAAKSGNFWLYTIIEKILDRAGERQKSFVKSQPIYAEARNWQLSYPSQADIDMLDIENEGCYWRISSRIREPVTDIDNYIQSTSHVWTHSRICERSLEVYPKFDKIVYIIRDPRDRLLSEAKFAFSDYMKTHFPSTTRDPDDYLEKNLPASMNRWRWHVYDHLRYADELDIHIIFYERLLKDFGNELDRLLEYLEVPLHNEHRQAIREEVKFSSMKKENDKHLKKKHYGNWALRLNQDQKKMAEDINEHLLHILRYPNGRFIPGLLPRVPENLSRSYMEQRLNDIGRYQ